MSLPSYQPANHLPDGVLLVIYDHLDYRDLLRCEAVCSQWRNVLLYATPWRRLFHRLSSRWRHFGIVEPEGKLETVHSKSFYKNIIHHLHDIDTIWRTGKFKRTDLFQVPGTIVAVGDKCIVNRYFCRDLNCEKFEFLDRRSLKFKGTTTISTGSFAVTNTEIVVVWNPKNIEIVGKDDQLISTVPELKEDEHQSWNIKSCCISGVELLVFSRTNGQSRLSLWDVTDPSRAICIKRRWFSFDLQLDCPSLMKMDGQFITSPTSNNYARFCVFSKQTLYPNGMISFCGIVGCNYTFYQGMLFVHFTSRNRKSEGSCAIRVFDVTSTHRRIIETTTTGNFEDLIGFNSKFMVVAGSSECTQQSQLNIYDLEAVKNPNSTDNELLVKTLVVEFPISRIVMDETLLICEDDKQRKYWISISE
jgi:hypothetical protein